jgi:uncharacterized protein YgiM (DUF1202 family)
MQCARTLTLLLALAAATAHAQSDALLIKRAAELRQGPSESSPSLTPLPVQTAVTRLPARQGAWIQVRTTAGTTGWIHMFDATTSSTESTVGSGSAAGALRGLTNFFNRGSAQGAGNAAATSTVGIRGLSGEDIANAQPNLAALAQADALRQDATQARKFASDALLLARSVDPLPAPEPLVPPTVKEFRP